MARRTGPCLMCVPMMVTETQGWIAAREEGGKTVPFTARLPIKGEKRGEEKKKKEKNRKKKKKGYLSRAKKKRKEGFFFLASLLRRPFAAGEQKTKQKEGIFFQLSASPSSFLVVRATQVARKEGEKSFLFRFLFCAHARPGVTKKKKECSMASSPLPHRSEKLERPASRRGKGRKKKKVAPSFLPFSRSPAAVRRARKNKKEEKRTSPLGAIVSLTAALGRTKEGKKGGKEKKKKT